LDQKRAIFGQNRSEFGILADQVFDVSVLRGDEVLEPPASAHGIGRSYLRGLTKDALIVLDGERLLRDPRLYVDQSPDGDRAPWTKEEG